MGNHTNNRNNATRSVLDALDATGCPGGLWVPFGGFVPYEGKMSLFLNTHLSTIPFGYQKK